jgi:hypothetical protein
MIGVLNLKCRLSIILVFSSIFACQESDPEEYLIIGTQEEEFALVSKPFDELDDARRLKSSIFQAFRGGTVDSVIYNEGGLLDIRYAVQDGVAIPADEDGLILWSFAWYLAEVRRYMLERGVEMGSMFPVTIAYAPGIGTDLTDHTNAFFVCGRYQHLYGVLPDFYNDLVPLAANQGVVRHEFGHHLFHYLVADSAPSCLQYEIDGNWLGFSAAHEGFADVVATLSLENPHFIGPSYPLDERDVRLDTHVADADTYTVSLSDADPYKLGSVIAAFAWDVREALGAENTLLAFIEAARRLRGVPENRDPEVVLVAPNELVLLVVEVLAEQHTDALETACTSLSVRFPTLESPQCS